MKVLMINVVCGIRSTGRICTDLATALEEKGHEVKIAYGRGNVPDQYKKYGVKIGSNIDILFHGLKARIFDCSGFGSKRATKKFIEWVKIYDPDVIHLHNIHGYYINIEILFDYLRTCGKKIIWTLHDCWSFTGHCTYFDFVCCNKWKTGCYHCPQKAEYPARLWLDMSKRNYLRKKKLFLGIDDVVLVTPSQWLADLVSNSFLKRYNTVVIKNGVDTKIFKSQITNGIKHKYNCCSKKIILGVAAVWDRRKGLDDFIKLSQKVGDSYQIVLVGLSKKQICRLPKNVIGIEKTNSATELAEIYSSAEVFFNPTYEDNYPTTNLESIACGTPVVSYHSGGSGESAVLFGCVVEKGDLLSAERAIYEGKYHQSQNCNIDFHYTVANYMKLYE